MSLAKFQKQTTKTNCFRTCVANYFGLPIRSVPRAFDGAENLWNVKKQHDWLRRRGVQQVVVMLKEGVFGNLGAFTSSMRCILVGPSPNSSKNENHAVLCDYQQGDEAQFEYVHDPAVSNKFLAGEAIYVVLFVPMSSKSLRV